LTRSIGKLFLTPGRRSHTPEEFSTVDNIVAGIKVPAARLHALAY
jgi:acetylornithine deacetylase/succinyl-diaminopimelate desuccinylase-like protein